MLQLIAYTSEYIGQRGDIDKVLKDISATAKTFNSSVAVTGVLFYHQGRFLQIIEGPATGINVLMEKIKKDSRHHNIETLIDDSTATRKFGEWNMDSFNLSAQEKLDLNELKRIRDAYQQNIKPEADTIAHFYKAMLTTHALQVTQGG